MDHDEFKKSEVDWTETENTGKEKKEIDLAGGSDYLKNMRQQEELKEMDKVD